MLPEKELFFKHIGQTSPEPLALSFTHAKGIYMYDTKGQEYIDLISGVGVSNLGHCYPSIVKAVKEQVEKYIHLMVYGELVQSPQVRLVHKLINVLPKSLNTVYLVNSGTEAIEGAMKLAKKYTGRTEFISFENAYHGATQGALSICGNKSFKTAFLPLLDKVKVIPYSSLRHLSYITSKTAAVFAESVQASAGVILPKKGYMQALRNKCNEMGALLIFDETQTGFGRTGKMWGFEHEKIIPDVITCAKGMGGGMPIGAFISSQEMMNVLKINPVLGHITTFGGNSVSSAAALASLESLTSQSIIAKVEEKALLFKRYLIHPSIKSLRYRGLLIALEFNSSKILQSVLKKCISSGILVNSFLFCKTAMRITPPLIITYEQIEKSCTKILASIDSI